jgi:predicted AlkP superfamily phosphohydrolase/phosphomutase
MAESHPETRVVMIGLDAVDATILQQMAAEGRLPTVAALLDESAVAETINPIGVFVGALWTSFATAVTAARHGRHAPTQVVPGTYDMKPLALADSEHPPFWQAISDAGRRVAIVDVPHSAPIDDLAGVQVFEWGTHDAALGLHTSPPELAADLVARFGHHPIHGDGRDCDTHGDGVKDFLQLRDGLLHGIVAKTDVNRHVLAMEQWDLFVTVFSEGQCSVHQCWHLRDQAHPRHDPATARAVGDVVEQVYVAFDEALSVLLSTCDEQTTVLVLASHAAGPHYDGNLLLDAILRRVEAQSLRWSRRWTRAAFDWAWPRAGWTLRRKHPRFRDRLWRGWSELPPLNPAGRRYFAVHNNEPYGGIRLNLIGREPKGRVAAGAAFDAVCAELTRELLAIVNTETGDPLVRRVLRTRDVYEGERLDHLPDLLVEWNWDAPIRSIASPTIGRMERTYRWVRTGDHRPPGLLIARGPGIAPGRIDPVDVTDIGPTVAALLGVGLADVDGHVIERIATSPSMS